MTSDSPKRKYAMRKGPTTSDWLLPGNDGKTLWRLSKEDSTDGPGWCLWRWHGQIGDYIDSETLKDWSQWDLEERCHPSRKSAMTAALKSELPRPRPKRMPDPRPIGQILADAYGLS